MVPQSPGGPRRHRRWGKLETSSSSGEAEIWSGRCRAKLGLESSSLPSGEVRAVAVVVMVMVVPSSIDSSSSRGRRRRR